MDIVSHWTWASILLQCVSYGYFYGATRPILVRTCVRLIAQYADVDCWSLLQMSFRLTAGRPSA